MPRGVKAGEAFVEFLVNTTKLEQGLKRAQVRLKAFGKGLQGIGFKLSLLGGALAAPFALATREFVNFETGLSRIDVLLNENTRSLAEFKKEIETLAVKFGVSKETLVGGLEDILQASIESSKAVGVLTAAVKLSKIGFTDVATAADALTTVINAYGFDAAQASRISDVLFTVVRKGKITFADLAQNIGNVATIASTSNVSIEELGAAIASMTRNGIKAEESVTSLRATLISFLKPQGDSVKLAKQYGLELSGAALANDGLLKSLRKIEGLPSDVIARIFPNVRALKGVLPLLKDLKGFEKDIDALSQSGGTADEQFKKIEKTLGFMFSRINQAGKQALEIVGEALSKDLKRASGAVIRLSKGFIELLKVNKELIPLIAKGVAGVVVMAVVITTLGTSIVALSFVIGAVASSVTAFIAVLTALFTPLGLLAALVATLAKVLVQRFGLVDKAMNILKTSFGNLKKKFDNTFGVIVDSVKRGNLQGAFKVAAAAIKLIWLELTTKLKSLWIDAKESIINSVIDLGTNIAAEFIRAFDKIEKKVVEIKQLFFNVFAAIKNTIFDVAAEISNFFADAAVNVLVNTGFADADVGEEAKRQNADVTKEKLKDNKKEKDDSFVKNQQIATALKKKNTKLANDRIAAAKKLGAALKKIAQETADIEKAALKEAKGELIQAQAELAKLTAAQKAANADIDSSENTTTAKNPFAKLIGKLEDVGKDFKLPETRKLSAVGSFSAVGIERGSNQMQFRKTVVGDTGEIRKDIRKIKRNQENGVGGNTFE